MPVFKHGGRIALTAGLGAASVTAGLAATAVTAGLVIAVSGCDVRLAGLGDRATLRIEAALSPGAYRTQALAVPALSPGAYRVLSVAPAGWAAADVQHVVVKLYALSGSTETAVLGSDGQPIAQDIPVANLSGTLSFDRLHHDAQYRVRGYAYKAAGTAEADQISLDASSSVDVTLGTDDRPAIAKLDIQLADRVFDGQATSSIDLVDGGYVDATASLTTATPS